MPKRNGKGFTLVEMLVALSIFATVMVVASGSLISIIAAHRKAQAIRSTIDNLDLGIESMVRSIRTGNTYYCNTGEPAVVSMNDVQDCSIGGSFIAFHPSEISPGILSDVIRASYTLRTNEEGRGYIERTLYASATSYVTLPVTSVENVDIKELKFHVIGTNPTDNIQPYVLIKIKGEVLGRTGEKATQFELQTIAVQRILDLP